MDVLETVAETQRRCLGWRAQGQSVALVPTMGYLHDRHLSLVRLARERADRVVVSIFVNPAQFGPGEDLSCYPRDEAGDLAKLRAEGVDLAFCPPPAEIYPPGFQTSVALAHLPGHLCGLSRPNHFGGVATVVAKLHGICQPTVAIYGEKDFQQLLVIRRMVRDLNQPVEVVGGPIVREPDGLARSSRNAYLSEDERRRAAVIHQALQAAAHAVAAGQQDAGRLVADIRARIETARGRVDYVSIVDEDTLVAVDTIAGTARAAVAAFFGKTRLIDNQQLIPPAA